MHGTRGWGWVERKQMMTPKEVEKYFDDHKKEAYALYVHSFAHLINDQLDKALGDLNAAVKADPKFAPALYGRGNLYAEKGDFDKALADFIEGKLIFIDFKALIAELVQLKLLRS